jgi:hypothetical protein
MEELDIKNIHLYSNYGLILKIYLLLGARYIILKPLHIYSKFFNIILYYLSMINIQSNIFIIYRYVK